MPYEDPKSMAAVGLRPAGTGPSVLETVIGSAGKMVDSYFDNQEKRFKREKEKTDEYISLRKAGYSPEEAAKVVQSGKFTLPTSKGESEHELDIEKKKADIAYTKARTKYYETPGEKGFEDPEDIPSSAGGLPLKKITKDKKSGLYFPEYGEKKSDVMDLININDGPETPAATPKAWTPPMWLSKLVGSWDTPAMAKEQKPKKEEDETEYIKAISPDGKTVKIPKANLSKAIAKGYKLR